MNKVKAFPKHSSRQAFRAYYETLVCNRYRAAAEMEDKEAGKIMVHAATLELLRAKGLNNAADEWVNAMEKLL